MPRAMAVGVACVRRGVVYAEGFQVYAEGCLRRGPTPTAALGVDYADGYSVIRRGGSAVGVAVHSCSDDSAYYLIKYEGLCT